MFKNQPSAPAETALPTGLDPIAALRESERRFRAISSYTYDWESWHDLSGRLQWVNAAVARMTGYSVQECLDMEDYPLPIVYQDDRRHIEQTLRCAVLGESGNDVEFRFLTKNQQICWGAISWQRIRDDNGVEMGFRTSVRDIAERKRLEEQIRGYAENLERLVEERTNRMLELEARRTKVEQFAALGQLAAGVAHEINNPLAGIRNAMELIKESVPTDFENRSLLDLVQVEIDRMSGIIRQLYQLHRPQPTSISPFDLHRMMAQTAQLLIGIARRRGVAINVVDSDGPPIWASLPEGELKQVLYNILLNAVQASPSGANVSLRVEVHGDEAAIRVTDHGPGIPSDVLPKVFDPFFTTKHGTTQPGMGLGLSVSQSLVQAMNGRIEIQTQIDQGTTFVVFVPRIEDSIDQTSC